MMIEITDEMMQAYGDARAALNQEQQHGRPYKSEDEKRRAGLAAVLAIVERDLAQRLEGPYNEGLCDCSGRDDDPTSPITGDPIDHHCDCAAVEATAAVFGRANTKHHAVCLCGRSS